MVINAFGDVVDPRTGGLVAGCREAPESLKLISAEDEMLRLNQSEGGFPEGSNTVVGVVATNAKLSKTQLTKVAQMAHDGLARTVYPAHTLYDGDAIFALSCGDLESVEVSIVGALAAQAVARSILRGVRKAAPYGVLPAHSSLINANLI
jgi:L-aminopeptidase/D-esterase-like protein